MKRLTTAEESGIDFETYKGKLYSGSYDRKSQTNVTDHYLSWEDALEALENELSSLTEDERSYVMNASVSEWVENIQKDSRIVDPENCQFVSSEYDTIDWKRKQKKWDIEKDYESWDELQEFGVEVLLASTKKNNDWVTFVPIESLDFESDDFTDSELDKENKILTLYSEKEINKLQWVPADTIPDKIMDSYFGTESRDYNNISDFVDFLLNDLSLDKDGKGFDVCLLKLLDEVADKLRKLRNN